MIVMEIRVVFVALSLAMQLTAATSLSGLKDQAFSVVGEENSLSRQTRSAKSSVKRMHVTSVIRARFAKVTTLSEIANTDDKAKQLTFSVRLPEAAFISDFTMLVNDVTFVGKVKEKALAEEEYEAAKGKGNPTGLVTADVRQTQTFNVAANVPAQSTVSFTLVYQELLKRRLGKYDHEIFVNPGQLVDDFIVNVYVTEGAGITTLEAKHPESGTGEGGKVASGYDQNGEAPIKIDIRRSKHQAKVTFQPTPAQQRRLLMIPEDDRKFNVIYDVTREVLGGEIRTRNGYFVHYFAPENLPVLPKKVVFVIDKSGSMSGRKIEQTKTAFATVLSEMSDADEFNIVTFSSGVTVWKPKEMVPVTTQSVADAIEYVRSIRATGSTDLNDGVLEAAKLLKDVKLDDKVSSAVILLTDGEPTTGVTNEDQIRGNVKETVGGRFSVFCLGFGDNLNHDFLKRLATDNDGIARKIFEDADADRQLEGFFQEIATPLLLNVKIRYNGANVAKVSKTNVDKYFSGSEIMVVGVKLEADQLLESTVSGVSKDSEVSYNVVSKEVDDDFQHWYNDTGNFDDFIERIWSYFTIKSLLEDKVLAETKAEVTEIVGRVMRLALKYNFVTPLTSMVVLLPEDTKTTTPGSSSTVHPPLPPCYLRGQTVRDDIIWCPYVVDENDILNQKPVTTRRGSRRPSRPRNRVISSLFRSPMHRPPAKTGFLSRGSPASAGPTGPMHHRIPNPRIQRIIASAGPTGPMHHRIPNPRIQSIIGGSTASRRRFYGGATSRKRKLSRPTPVNNPNCGGTLSTTSGRIVSPGDLGLNRGSYCIWNIKLPKGSWIDFYVDKLNTSRNKVTVTTKGKEVLLQHNGGVKPPRYIPVAHSRIKIKMTIIETAAEGSMTFSYKKFVPDTSATLTSDSDGDSSPPPSNCGQGISSSESTSGFITSPNYPSAYRSEASCLWTFTNEDPERLQLQFTIVDMDIVTYELGKCGQDKLIVPNGNQTKVLCGFQWGDPIIADAFPETAVRFLSDAQLEARGFNATYAFVPRKIPNAVA